MLIRGRFQNIHIDTGSWKSIDMSYTGAARLYIGDASSQVYEFLRQPQPCLFLNPGAPFWRSDPNFRHWQCGPVCDDPDTFGTTLTQAVERHAEFLPAQQRLFRYTFDLSDISSAYRTANAIMSFLQSTGSRPIG